VVSGDVLLRRRKEQQHMLVPSHKRKGGV